ncbi:RidA family protein [Carboxydothermus hydrogenoformans]|uniref:Endoribonuclease L-PSP family protein n=1 Tax=Carboxydothermus hydrogenoformans (strain ATCC BAA-161 / DSM 6008 / Z-2901) TaxID=246194 RepID=Q3AFF9_CARHZ|nr:RidA family protein [Carboxydothermus hydrogenoformans]ABB16188.1 endoribonuclease L-PSP family protein [Carboxydothermus hydrogenoformans Z-2901]
MKIEQKLNEMGMSLPPAPAPVAAYVPGVLIDNYIYVSGQLPFEGGELKTRGKLGAEVTVEEGMRLAKVAALNCLAVVKGLIGDLDRIEKIIKVTGYVASSPGFNDQPKVINGASEFLAELLGDAGKHARAAVGVNELPLNSPVEVEMIVKVR